MVLSEGRGKFDAKVSYKIRPPTIKRYVENSFYEFSYLNPFFFVSIRVSIFAVAHHTNISKKDYFLPNLNHDHQG